MKRARLSVEVRYAARAPWVPGARQLATWADCAVPATMRHGQLSVVVVGSARSRRLNREYRGKDKPTNVLSFSGNGRAPDGNFYLGELIVCAPVVAREARQQGKRLQAHWAHMTVHGVLHLLGMDHEKRRDALKMESREVQILERLGFSDPYV